ncbi:hypothetical protein DL96DRAFT_1573404 [Flagelloscypha sp. PMI_526]|nr:hypothetical protein DL96DRAFT_1573404 [Flagelloscypha sp. PMI_526]
MTIFHTFWIASVAIFICALGDQHGIFETHILAFGLTASRDPPGTTSFFVFFWYFLGILLERP